MFNAEVVASKLDSADPVRDFEADFRKDLTSFVMPTLIVHGGADAFAPAEATAHRTHQGIKGSRLEIYPGASHALFFTHQDRLNRDIGEFVGEGARS